MQPPGPDPQVPPRVRVVVINFDGGDVTRRCVDSLLATDYPADRLQIVVVDNASVDGLNWTLREQYPQVTLIQSDTNEGFARGCNLGMRDLDDVHFVALINNDAMVEPGWLRPLLDRIGQHPRIGAVVPKLVLNLWAHAVLLEPASTNVVDGDRRVGVSVDELAVDGVDAMHRVRFDERFWPDHPRERGRWTKGTASVWWPCAAPDEGSTVEHVRLELSAPAAVDVAIGTPSSPSTVQVGPQRRTIDLEVGTPVRVLNSAGGALYSGWMGGDRGFLEPDLGQYDTAEEVFSWCGGAVLLRAEYLREVGLFDPTFFLYYEDFDLSWRGRSAGWTYWYEPSVAVFHEHAYSSKAGSDFFRFWVERNRVLTLVKNAPAKVAARAWLGCLALTVELLARHTLQRLRRLRPPSPTACRALSKTFVSATAALPSALRERRRISSERTVPHSTLDRWMLTK